MSKDCIIARGSPNTWGYGRLKYKGQIFSAHILSYLLFNGSIPKGKQIDHICRNRKCINPKHLRVTTSKDNILCGNGIAAINHKKTHCKNGHKFTQKNTYWRKENNKRDCRKCRKIASKKYLERNRK